MVLTKKVSWFLTIEICKQFNITNNPELKKKIHKFILNFAHEAHHLNIDYPTLYPGQSFPSTIPTVVYNYLHTPNWRNIPKGAPPVTCKHPVSNNDEDSTLPILDTNCELQGKQPILKHTIEIKQPILSDPSVGDNFTVASEIVVPRAQKSQKPCKTITRSKVIDPKKLKGGEPIRLCRPLKHNLPKKAMFKRSPPPSRKRKGDLMLLLKVKTSQLCILPPPQYQKETCFVRLTQSQPHTPMLFSF